MASGLEARRRWMAASAKPTEPLRWPGEEVGGELVRFIEHDKVPAGGAKLILQIFVAQSDDEMVQVFKRVPAGRDGFQFPREHPKIEAEHKNAESAEEDASVRFSSVFGFFAIFAVNFSFRRVL
jgi:hypothetical protein